MPKEVRRGDCRRRLWRRWRLPCNIIILALPLLAFWLLAAILLFLLSLGLLCVIGVQTAGDETIALVGTLIAAIIGFAVQQWNTLAQEEKERRERRHRALREIEDLRKALRAGDYVQALSLYRSFRERQRGGPWEDLEVERVLESAWLETAPVPLRVWTGLCEEPGELRVDRECVEALVWAWRLEEERAERVLDKMIAKENLRQLVEVLGSDAAGVLLLRSPGIGKRLDALHREKDLSQEQKKDLRKLRTLRRRPVRLPPPWYGVDRPPDPEDVAEAVRRLGLSGNPFGPEQAELDPKMKDYGIWPRSLSRARGPRPALVFGSPGHGKTAAALLLMYRCLFPPANPEEGKVFPVRLDLIETWPETCPGWLDVLGRAVAETLLQASVLDPYALFEQKPDVASAIAFLFSTHLRSDALELRLRRAEMEEGSRYYVLGEVQRLTGGFTLETPLDVYTTLDLIGKARPAGLTCTYIFLDLPSVLCRWNLSTVTASLQPLLEIAMPLASRGVYLKAFLPDRLREGLAGAWFEEPISLVWSDNDLLEMLRRRLTGVVKIESLEQICDAEARQLAPDERLVRAAKGSPRELVRLGNRMLAGARSAKLTSEDLP
ncbi:MAG TPA: hypothetical protein EYP77_05845 [Anaerolineae bacterium]|nr:hypothetical protein [Anaerolineae bacterium]